MTDDNGEPRIINLGDVLKKAEADRREREHRILTDSAGSPISHGPPESTFPTCTVCRRHVEEYRDAVLEREQMRKERDEARAEVERLRAVIRWLHGVEGPFPIRGEGEGTYWWRKELRRRVAGMVDLEAKEAADG